MLKTRATFKCKEPDLKPRECVVEKVITLGGTQYDSFAARMHLKYDFIRDNIELMRCDSNDVYHCLLVVGEGREDGILIQSEGADYARYTALMPHAASILAAQKGSKALAELNSKLVGIVDEIAVKILCCPPDKSYVVVDIGDLEREFGLELEYNDALTDIISDMLYEKTEVRDVEIHQNKYYVIPDSHNIKEQETDCQTEQEQGEASSQAMSM